MKNQNYHLTTTGIRIPKHKIKWEKPMTDEALGPLVISPSERKDFESLDLFIHNYNTLVNFFHCPADDDTINAEDLKERNCNEG